VISDGDLRETKLCGPFEHILQPDRTVEQTILGVQMKVNEPHIDSRLRVGVLLNRLEHEPAYSALLSTSLLVGKREIFQALRGAVLGAQFLDSAEALPLYCAPRFAVCGA